MGAIDIGADDVLRSRSEKNPDRGHKVDEWLTALLGDGAIEQATVLEQARFAGFHPRAVQRSAVRLGIAMVRGGNRGHHRSVWALANSTRDTKSTRDTCDRVSRVDSVSRVECVEAKVDAEAAIAAGSGFDGVVEGDGAASRGSDPVSTSLREGGGGSAARSTSIEQDGERSGFRSTSIDGGGERSRVRSIAMDKGVAGADAISPPECEDGFGIEGASLSVGVVPHHVHATGMEVDHVSTVDNDVDRMSDRAAA